MSIVCTAFLALVFLYGMVCITKIFEYVSNICIYECVCSSFSVGIKQSMGIRCPDPLSVTLSHNKQGLVETMKVQTELGGMTDGSLHRLALSDTDKTARDWFCKQSTDADFDVRIHAIGRQ